MRDLSKEIEVFTQRFRSDCGAFSNGECKRENGCACKKMGEIHALIYDLVPSNLRHATIHDFTGKDKQGNQIIDTEVVNGIKKILNTYLYGRASIDKNLDRIELNKLSVLNEQFKRGVSVIVHGASSKTEKNFKGRMTFKHRQSGKSLLAAIIMIDAIYRKKYPASKVWNYDWVSFINLKQLLKERSDKMYDIQDSDWLVIDDITEIDQGMGSRSEIWTREVFDSFLIDRMNERKPTILICGFDLDDISIEPKMGLAFQKLYNDETTFRIKV